MSSNRPTRATSAASRRGFCTGVYSRHHVGRLFAGATLSGDRAFKRPRLLIFAGTTRDEKLRPATRPSHLPSPALLPRRELNVIAADTRQSTAGDISPILMATAQRRYMPPHHQATKVISRRDAFQPTHGAAVPADDHLSYLPPSLLSMAWPDEACLLRSTAHRHGRRAFSPQTPAP